MKLFTAIWPFCLQLSQFVDRHKCLYIVVLSLLFIVFAPLKTHQLQSCVNIGFTVLDS